MQERRIYDRIADSEAGDSLGKIFRRISRPSRILDVGVGCGALGQMVQMRGVGTIDGIDFDRLMLERARPYYQDLFEADIDAVDPCLVVGARRYDVIVVADVIEHLRFPSRAVKLLSKLLLDGGKMLFSVPNVTYLGVLCELASGKFCYRNEGLLDKTHLRFFSHDSLHEMIADAELMVTHEDTVQMPLSLSEFKDYDPHVFLNMDRVGSMPHALAYQFIVEAVPVRKGG